MIRCSVWRGGRTPTTPGADYRPRIFAPGGGLPFAGHPTLGSAHAWVQHRGRPRSDERIIQECAAGLVEVRRGEAALSFAAPPMIRTGPLDESFVDDIVTAFGIDRDRVLAHQWVDNGPGWAVVQLATADEVLALEPDLSRIPDAMVGAIGAYPAGGEHAFEMRTFAPGVGVTEDPACGSMNASVGQWFTSTGRAPRSYAVSQGTRIGRAGTIQVNADATATSGLVAAARSVSAAQSSSDACARRTARGDTYAVFATTPTRGSVSDDAPASGDSGGDIQPIRARIVGYMRNTHWAIRGAGVSTVAGRWRRPGSGDCRRFAGCWTAELGVEPVVAQDLRTVIGYGEVDLPQFNSPPHCLGHTIFVGAMVGAGQYLEAGVVVEEAQQQDGTLVCFEAAPELAEVFNHAVGRVERGMRPGAHVNAQRYLQVLQRVLTST